MMIFAKAFHVLVSGTSSCNIITACVRGLHVQYALRVGFMGTLVVEARLAGGRFYKGPCDGSCKNRSVNLRELVMAENFYESESYWESLKVEARHWTGLDMNPAAREYSRTLFEDGDSDEAFLCNGSVHVRRECHEFGSGSSFQIASACDHRSCRPQRVRLPPAVVRYLAS